ncbi:MAG: glutathione S-transferase family protein [Azospirillaceae bacterium]
MSPTPDTGATSTPTLDLVSHPLCPYVQRAAIALAEKGVAHRRVTVDLADKPAWFRAISPLGKVPLLRVHRPGGASAILFESAVICEYLEETHGPPLHPADPVERARHRAWIEFASALLDGIAGFYRAPDATAFEERRHALVERIGRLEETAGAGPYFAGEAFSLVDAAFGPVFRYFDTFERIADFGFFDAAPRVRAWRAALARRPSVARAVDADYPGRLEAFLVARGSHLSTLMARSAA